MDGHQKRWKGQTELRTSVLTNIIYTISAQIRGQQLIKKLGFYGGGLLQFLPKNAPKSLKKGTFGPKKWWLNQE